MHSGIALRTRQDLPYFKRLSWARGTCAVQHVHIHVPFQYAIYHPLRPP